MCHVSHELATNGITDIKFWNLMEQFIFQERSEKEENHTELRVDYDELATLNDAISGKNAVEPSKTDFS